MYRQAVAMGLIKMGSPWVQLLTMMPNGLEFWTGTEIPACRTAALGFNEAQRCELAVATLYIRTVNLNFIWNTSPLKRQT